MLDAGCGCGGSSIYLAQHCGARVEGVSLSEKQLHLAKKRSQEAGTADRVRFTRQDYSRTTFGDGSFTKIFGLESVCHAASKPAFLKEAHRLLVPNGRLVVVDAFLARRRLVDEVAVSYWSVLAGWALPGLESKASFHSQLAEAGFKNISFDDKTRAVRKSADKIYRLGLAAYAVTFLLSALRLVHRSVHGHTKACINQKKLVDRKAIVYGVFCAEK